MVYEVDSLVGILLALSPLYNLPSWLTTTTLIGLDNQATIKALNNQLPHPSHYLLDHIHTAIEKLHEKQDKLQNADDSRRVRHTANPLITNSHGIIDLKLQWVPGHVDFPPKKKADANVKRAARGNQSSDNLLPKILRKPLPSSILVIQQKKKLQIHHKCFRWWKTSSRYPSIHMIDKTTLLKKWLQLVSKLTWVQASILLQLHTGHIGLNRHLHHIKQSNSPACPNCNHTPQETVHHFLFECSKYHQERFTIQWKLGCYASTLSYLLTNSAAIKPLLNYIHDTQCLRQTYGSLQVNTQTQQ